MLSEEPFVCPAHLLERASGAPPAPTALAGAAGAVALASARLAWEAGLIEPWLVGEPEQVAEAAREIGWDLGEIRVIPAAGEPEIASRSVELARRGLVRGIMKGQIHTDQLMRAVVDRDHGLRTQERLSHVFYMTVPGRQGALSITDAAVNVAPTPDQRLSIARNAVALHHALGHEQPRLAVLSASETPIASMPSSLEALEIARRAQAGEIEGALVEGPLSLDLAVSPRAAEVKGVKGAVAGRADIVLVPNIETGNALFKAMVYFLSATAAGIILGAQVPIILTSRADPPEARLAGAALAAIYAYWKEDN
jgi:phosphate acetyltransferase